MKPKTIVILALLLIIIVGGIAWLATREPAVSELDGFAQCLKDKGAVFYGAFWCPHCLDQKKLFGTAKRFLPYVECSTPDGNRQTQICIDKNIKGYPLWQFADGTEQSGLMSLAMLAEKTACVLPAGQ